MRTLPKSIERLITSLSQLPGIGPKTASRLVFYLIRHNQIDLSGLGEAFARLKEDLVYCGICHNIADADPCTICTDKNRHSEMESGRLNPQAYLSGVFLTLAHNIFLPRAGNLLINWDPWD